MTSEPNSFDSGAWISDLRNHADAKSSIVHYKRMTKIIRQIIYLFGTIFLFIGLFLPFKKSRNVANDAIRTVLTTHLLTYSTEVSTYIGTTMNKYRTISIFLENLNDNPELIRCSDKLMPQLVKFVKSVAKNIQPIPYKFFSSQLQPTEEQRVCQFEFDPLNSSNYKLYYLFELDGNTIQMRSYDDSIDYETWDPFNQGTFLWNISTSILNFSLFSIIGTETSWFYIQSEVGNDSYNSLPQMTVFSPSSNSKGELTSVSGISFFTKDIYEMIEKIPCVIINSSESSANSKFVDNQNAFVKYALLSSKNNKVIIEKDIGAVEPLVINDVSPQYPTLSQLNSSFWSELSEVIFNYKENEVFEFKFDKVLYLVVHTGVSSFKSLTNSEPENINKTNTPGIINKIIHSIEPGNETHTFIACFPIDPSIQTIYYPISMVFVFGFCVFFITFFVSLLLINREKVWRIRKIALQKPKFKSGSNNEYFSFHQAPNSEIVENNNNNICPYLGYIPHSVVKIRNFQLEYPDDPTLNKALDGAVENLTLREDQKFTLMKKNSCEFCKYFLPEKMDFQKETISITAKKSGRLSRKMTSMSHRKSSNVESEDLINSDESDNDDHDYYSPKLNLNVNVEDETDEYLYKIWKTKSFPKIQVLSKKINDDENIHHVHRSKMNKNKFIWVDFQIDQFLSEPHRMLMRYMMTLLSDCQLLFPPFDPMCVANFLISIEKGIINPVHAAHQLFSVHQVIYGPFNYWITNKLDILVLFFAVYFSHFDYKQYVISKSQDNIQKREQESNKNDEDSTNFSDSKAKSDFNFLNENSIEITMEGFQVFNDDFSKVEENLKELKRMMLQIFPIRSSLKKAEYESTSQRNDSGLLDLLNSYNSDIPDSQSVSSSNQNINMNDNLSEKNKSQAKSKGTQNKRMSNSSAFQNLKNTNKRSYSNITAQDANPESLMAAAAESETENTETQTTETMTSLSFSMNGYEDDTNFEKSRANGVKNKTELTKKKRKKNKDNFWYFWKTLKKIMFKTCIKNKLFDLLGAICVRIQSPYLDIHNDYGDKLYFMISVLKLCEMSAYWSPIEIMEKAIEIENHILFTNEEISDKYFISSFHLEYCQKIVMPWVKMLSLFKQQAFDDVIKNLLAVIDYWAMKKENAIDFVTEENTNLNNNDNDIKLIDDEENYLNGNDKTNSSDDNEYNFCDND